MAPKKKTPGPSGLVLASPAPSLNEAILQRIEAKLDKSRLVDELAEQVAAKITESIRIEELVEQILEHRRTELTATLAERILGGLAI